MNVQIISLTATILLAIAGYLFKYFYELKVQKRNNYLLLLNDRIEKFYGPLYIMSIIGKTSYQTFVKILKKENDPNLKESLSEEEKREWILWVKEVFHKNNLETENILIHNAHLIIEENLPQCLIDFITHISNNKILIKKWEEGEFKQIFSLIDFPGDLQNYAYKSYILLKKSQLKFNANR